MIERLRVRIPAGVAGELSSPELTLCGGSFAVRSTPVLPQWHVKYPGHSAESAGGRLHLDTHIPFNQRSRRGLTMPLCRHSAGSLSGNELICNSSGNTRPQMSQFAEPLWTDPGLISEISVGNLIFTF